MKQKENYRYWQPFPFRSHASALVYSAFTVLLLHEYVQHDK